MAPRGLVVEIRGAVIGRVRGGVGGAMGGPPMSSCSYRRGFEARTAVTPTTA
jgi:hypothetical protein